MHLLRFRGETVSEALARARTGLGPDAVVLSTRLVPARGWRGLTGRREVELTAATDPEMSEVRSARQELRQSVPVPAPAAAVADGLAARLEAAGFAPAIVREVTAVRRVVGRRGASADAVRHAVREWAAPLTAADEGLAAVEVFVGPPGAGKTTTVAKIAAQERARRGVRLRLVSADGFRVGAVEQLRMYADIIGAPFAAAHTAAELDRALMGATAPVLVDTAGRSARDGSSREVLEVLGGARGVRTHLVIPANSSAREVSRMLALHAAERPTRIIITKVDEAESSAALASVLKDSGLRVSFLGTGQRVPEDLLRATGPHLAAALLGDPPQESAA
jgi:flagellar biosynthesis protein FlhF